MTDYKVNLNVLGYLEDGEYVALALEMDLRGYGETFDEAMGDLKDQVAMQLSYSLYKTNSLDMAFKPAESVWHSLYATARIEALRNLTHQSSVDYCAADIPLPDAHVIEAMKGQYTANHA